MDISTYQALFDWISHHPGWSGLIIFLIAFSESLIIVGIVLPGVALLFGIGALIGADIIGFWPSVIAAFLGAVAGDGISFLIGRHYRERMHAWWPFNKHPEMLANGQAYFQRHGGKSIIVGRFVGPIRPVIPAIAGSFGLSPAYFFSINIFSAMAWAPAYLMPGILFGSAINLASGITTRFSLFLVSIAVLLALIIWLVRYFFQLLLPGLMNMIHQLVGKWSKQPRLGHLLKDINTGGEQQFKTISSLFAVFATIFFLGFMVIILLNSGELLSLDRWMLEQTHHLRMPWIDQVSLFFYYSVHPFSLSLMMAFLALFTWLNNSPESKQLFRITITSAVLMQMFQMLTAYLFSWPYSFISIAVFSYGTLLIAMTKLIRFKYHWLLYSGFWILLIMQIMSLVYVDQQILSLQIFSLAASMLVLLVIAGVFSECSAGFSLGYLAGLSAAFFVFSFTVSFAFFSEDLNKRLEFFYAIPETNLDEFVRAREKADLPKVQAGMQQWLWAGDENKIKTILQNQGWQKQADTSMKNFLLWFADHKTDDIPLLPRFVNGRKNEMTYVLKSAHGEFQRLDVWTYARLNNQEKIWYCEIKPLRIVRRMNWVNYPVFVEHTSDGFDYKSLYSEYWREHQLAVNNQIVSLYRED
ncbi:MAG: DedA family protein [Gammaproteobacteria bacterium]|nr:DedA family protein [Gammaproteobacteria bacterium]